MTTEPTPEFSDAELDELIAKAEEITNAPNLAGEDTE